MQKILNQAKNIVIFILLLTVVPLGFVKGFFAYLNYVGDAEIATLLDTTGDVYYKRCLDAAILSFIKNPWIALCVLLNLGWPIEVRSILPILKKCRIEK